MILNYMNGTVIFRKSVLQDVKLKSKSFLLFAGFDGPDEELQDPALFGPIPDVTTLEELPPVITAFDATAAIDVAVAVVDGSYHDVDSSEMAFKIAASKC